MSDSVQCPNCGGYKTETRTVHVDKSSGRPLVIQWNTALWLMMLGGGLCFSSLLPLVIGNIDWSCTVGSIFAAVLFLLIGSYGMNSTFKAVQVNHHRCYLCGYEWSRREDEPLPQIKVSPDLIAKGQQLLEEQEEQQRQAQMADWWWRQQQQGKK